jgi:antitoxin HicB
MAKSTEYYTNLPYTIEMRPSTGEGWFVRIRELSGCMSQGDTAEEAARNIREAMQLWIEAALEDGYPIPEPRPEEEFSGKFLVRVPRSLHRELAERAQQEGVSLNQLITSLIPRALAQSSGTMPTYAVPKNARRSRATTGQSYGPFWGSTNYPSTGSQMPAVLHESSDPFETQTNPGDSMGKYKPLYDYFRGLPSNTNSCTLAFNAIIGILGSTLPKSAHKWEAWWANDGSHVQAQAWLAAGWQKDRVDLKTQEVRFRRSS